MDANTRHIDPFPAKSLRNGWGFQAPCEVENYPLFRVVTVNHFACFTTTNSHLLPLSPTRAQVYPVKTRNETRNTKRNETRKRKWENGNRQLRRNKDAQTIIIFSKKRRRNEDETKRNVPLHGNEVLTFFGPYCTCTYTCV